MNGMNDKELQELTEESEEISAEYKSDETELDAQDGTGSSDEDEDEEENDYLVNFKDILYQDYASGAVEKGGKFRNVHCRA